MNKPNQTKIASQKPSIAATTDASGNTVYNVLDNGHVVATVSSLYLAQQTLVRILNPVNQI